MIIFHLPSIVLTYFQQIPADCLYGLVRILPHSVFIVTSTPTVPSHQHARVDFHRHLGPRSHGSGFR